jgi:hypothetical protein
MEQEDLDPVKKEDSQWGKLSENNFGYESNDERLEKRGMEDWELVEKIPESQLKVPFWFWAVVVIVLLVGVGLSFPFWGLRPGVVIKWTDWVKDPGFLGSLVYVAAAGTFIWYMVHKNEVSIKDKLDSEKEGTKEP